MTETASPVSAGSSRRGSARALRLAGLLIAGGIFIAAGALKVFDPKDFAKAIIEYRLVPEAVAPAIGVFLPWWEVVAGVLAIAGGYRRGALAVLAGLSAAFLVSSAITILRGLSPACACFGVLSARIGPATVVMDAGLLLLTGVLLVMECRQIDNSARINNNTEGSV
jgi:putative oxidoreductase